MQDMSQEHPTAEPTKNPRQRFPLMAWLVMGLVMMVAYPLSAGPVVWMFQHDYLPDSLFPAAQVFYAPLAVIENFPWALRLFEWYTGLWTV